MHVGEPSLWTPPTRPDPRVRPFRFFRTIEAPRPMRRASDASIVDLDEVVRWPSYQRIKSGRAWAAHIGVQSGVVVTPRYDDLDEGWLYLYDVTHAVWYEYEVRRPWPQGVATYHRILWDPAPEDSRASTDSGAPAILLAVDTVYAVAYSTVQWSRARLADMEQIHERDERMQILNVPAFMIGRTDVHVSTAESLESLWFPAFARIRAAVVAGFARQDWLGFQVEDPVGELVRLADNYQEMRAQMQAYLDDLAEAPLFRVALATNKLLGPKSGVASDVLDLLSRPTIAHALGEDIRHQLRAEIVKDKESLLRALSPVSIAASRLLPALRDYLALPAETKSTEDRTQIWPLLWQLMERLLRDIAAPAYDLDLALAADPEAVFASDAAGCEDPGLIFLGEISDPDGCHPLFPYIFVPLEMDAYGAVDARVKVDDRQLEQSVQLVRRTAEFLFKFLSCFEQLGLDTMKERQKKVTIDLLIKAGMNVTVTKASFEDLVAFLDVPTKKEKWLLSAQIQEDTAKVLRSRKKAKTAGVGELVELPDGDGTKVLKLYEIKPGKKPALVGGPGLSDLDSGRASSGHKRLFNFRKVKVEVTMMKEPGRGLSSWALTHQTSRIGLGAVWGMLEWWNLQAAWSQARKLWEQGADSDCIRLAADFVSASLDALMCVKDVAEVVGRRSSVQDTKAGALVPSLPRLRALVGSRGLRIAGRMASGLSAVLAALDLRKNIKEDDHDAAVTALLGAATACFNLWASFQRVIPDMRVAIVAALVVGVAQYLYEDTPLEEWIKRGPFYIERPGVSRDEDWNRAPNRALEGLLNVLCSAKVVARAMRSRLVPTMIREGGTGYDEEKEGNAVLVEVTLPYWLTAAVLELECIWFRDGLIHDSEVDRMEFQVSETELYAATSGGVAKICLPIPEVFKTGDGFIIEVKACIDAFGDGTTFVPSQLDLAGPTPAGKLPRPAGKPRRTYQSWLKSRAEDFVRKETR